METSVAVPAGEMDESWDFLDAIDRVARLEQRLDEAEPDDE